MVHRCSKWKRRENDFYFYPPLLIKKPPKKFCGFDVDRDLYISVSTYRALHTGLHIPVSNTGLYIPVAGPVFTHRFSGVVWHYIYVPYTMHEYLPFINTRKHVRFEDI
jgi:hypothetical protein